MNSDFWFYSSYIKSLELQGDQLNMTVFFCSLEKVTRRVVYIHWTSHFFWGTRNTRLCLTGHSVSEPKLQVIQELHFFKGCGSGLIVSGSTSINQQNNQIDFKTSFECQKKIVFKSEPKPSRLALIRSLSSSFSAEFPFILYLWIRIHGPKWILVHTTDFCNFQENWDSSSQRAGPDGDPQDPRQPHHQARRYRLRGRRQTQVIRLSDRKI